MPAVVLASDMAVAMMVLVVSLVVHVSSKSTTNKLGRWGVNEVVTAVVVMDAVDDGAVGWMAAWRAGRGLLLRSSEDAATARDRGGRFMQG